MKRFRALAGNDPVVYLGLSFLTAMLACALFAPHLAPHDPSEVRLASRLLPVFSPGFLLGTDQLGRCEFSRLIWGARSTLGATVAILGISLSVGVLSGAFSGLVGKAPDSVIMMLTDTVLAFPSLILALVVVGCLGPGLESVILALGLVRWVGYCRVTRNVTLSLKERTYIAVARISGAGRWPILRGHILPKLLPTVAVMAVLDFGRIIITVSAMSFLGLGASSPDVEWGAMLGESRLYMLGAPRLFILPGLVISLTVAAVQILAAAFAPAVRLRGNTPCKTENVS